MASSAHPQRLGRTVSLEAQLIRCGFGYSCFFPSFSETQLSTIAVTKCKNRKTLFQKKVGVKGKREKEEKVTCFQTWMQIWQFHLLVSYVCMLVAAGESPAFVEAFWSLLFPLPTDCGSVLHCNQSLCRWHRHIQNAYMAAYGCIMPEAWADVIMSLLALINFILFSFHLIICQFSSTQRTQSW